MINPGATITLEPHDSLICRFCTYAVNQSRGYNTPFSDYIDDIKEYYNIDVYYTTAIQININNIKHIVTSVYNKDGYNVLPFSTNQNTEYTTNLTVYDTISESFSIYSIFEINRRNDLFSADTLLEIRVEPKTDSEKSIISNIYHYTIFDDNDSDDNLNLAIDDDCILRNKRVCSCDDVYLSANFAEFYSSLSTNINYISSQN